MTFVAAYFCFEMKNTGRKFATSHETLDIILINFRFLSHGTIELSMTRKDDNMMASNDIY